MPDAIPAIAPQKLFTDEEGSFVENLAIEASEVEVGGLPAAVVGGPWSCVSDAESEARCILCVVQSPPHTLVSRPNKKMSDFTALFRWECSRCSAQRPLPASTGTCWLATELRHPSSSRKRSGYALERPPTVLQDLAIGMKRSAVEAVEKRR